MSILIICPNRESKPWLDDLTKVDPSIEYQIWPNVTSKDKVTFALTWQHPEGVFNDYPNLKCICSMGAGVDNLLRDPYLPESVPIVRLVDPGLAQAMFEYVCSSALFYVQNTALYQEQQAKKIWLEQPTKSLSETTIGIMGLGKIGEHCATQLSQLGFKVRGWSRNLKKINGVTSFAGNDQLLEFAKGTNILVCLLPLTEELTGILNLRLFKSLAEDACLINVARGAHLNEDDLIEALETNVLSCAFLDVFIQEPLPLEHVFWNNKKIHMTPHSSSITNTQAVAPQIINNYRLMCNSKPLLNQVNVKQGY
ncbi:MAG: glyoxylate/hydroxypyruvate reductase A [Gammaproteobacteria bacterium]|nr:MAG: glyoxylate/hydroxypyruvate reductase A [Gammaproteobacteria bacterium]